MKTPVKNLAMFVAFGFAMSGCSDESTGPRVAALILSNTELAVGVGLRAQVAASVRLENGTTAAPSGKVTWSTSDASVASVDADGFVRGERLGGPVTVTAKFGGRSASVDVTVIPVSVEISPNLSTLALGADVQFTAVALDAEDRVLEAGPAVWSTFPLIGTGSGTVSETGRLSVFAPGVLELTASIAGQDGTLTIGVPSTFDGTWRGITDAQADVEFVVQFGQISSFRMPTTVRQSCARQALSVQSAMIGSDDRFTLSLSNLPNVVTGKFSSPIDMTGTFGEIRPIPGCSAVDGEATIPAGLFSASR